MSQNYHEHLLPPKRFIQRQLMCLAFGFGLLCIALSIGVLGYRMIGGLEWVDALLNASMILGGMGPVDAMKTDASKIFASVYALFSGVVFIGIMAIILSPGVHRLLHKFHLDDKDLK